MSNKRVLMTAILCGAVGAVLGGLISGGLGIGGSWLSGIGAGVGVAFGQALARRSS